MSFPNKLVKDIVYNLRHDITLPNDDYHTMLITVRKPFHHSCHHIQSQKRSIVFPVLPCDINEGFVYFLSPDSKSANSDPILCTRLIQRIFATHQNIPHNMYIISTWRKDSVEKYISVYTHLATRVL
jgi:hypothetical protein